MIILYSPIMMSIPGARACNAKAPLYLNVVPFTNVLPPVVVCLLMAGNSVIRLVSEWTSDYS